MESEIKENCSEEEGLPSQEEKHESINNIQAKVELTFETQGSKPCLQVNTTQYSQRSHEDRGGRKKKVTIKTNGNESPEKSPLASITCSPIRHEILASNKQNRRNFQNRPMEQLKSHERLQILQGDRTEIEKEEKMYEVHNAKGKFSCMCQVCQEDDDGYQQADLSLSPDNAGLANLQKGLKEIPDKLRKTLQIIQTENRYERYGGFPKSFCWLIEHLLPPARSVDTIKGCELIFPDTVFFERGKAKLVVKMDKDYCLQGFKNATKLNIQNIYKDFSNAVRERKKDTHGIFYMRYGPNFAENNAID